MSVSKDILLGVLTGIIAGIPSGLLGVSPGGILVPVISLVLGFSQHVAQAVSLVAQAPPTSLTGLSEYGEGGHRPPLLWALVLSCAFIAGSLFGAALTHLLSDNSLRWMFVGYLLLLAVIVAARRSKAHAETGPFDATGHLPSFGLVTIGTVGGLSSGMLGIGGGLAITALSILLLRQTQRRAQALSLMVTALPLTLPSAWMYIRMGWNIPLSATAGIIAGLIAGTKAGAMAANKLPEHRLRYIFIALILAMALYMGAGAVAH